MSFARGLRERNDTANAAPGIGRESGGDEGHQHRAGLALAFAISETCDSDSPAPGLDKETEQIAAAERLCQAL